MYYRASEDPRIRPITDAFLDVYNYFGFGLTEKAYCGGLVLELRSRGHRVEREVAIDVRYKGSHVAWQRVDLIVDRSVIVEIKAGEILPKYAERQLMNYLSVSPLTVGLLLFFGPEPRYRRLLHERKRFAPAEPLERFRGNG